MLTVHCYMDRDSDRTRGLWVRLGRRGPGLHFRILPAGDPWRFLTFSERYGYRKVWRWGRFALSPLRRVDG